SRGVGSTPGSRRPDSTAMAPRRLLPLLFVALSIGAAACGAGERPTRVAAGGDPQAVTSTTTEATTTPAPATSGPSTSTSVPATSTAGSDASSTTAPLDAPRSDEAAASPVDGLDASQLRQAVEAPA